jgi:simple sugar transport system ATP-binding protein
MGSGGSDGTGVAVPPLLAAHGLVKRFGAVNAIRRVDLEATPGTVLALVGDNGAGKSTVIKILSGLIKPDEGELYWSGERVELHSARDAHELGIATVYQDLAVVDVLSVYRNMFMGRESVITHWFGPLRLLDHRRAREMARRALEDIGINLPSVDQAVESLSGGQRQSIAIARALMFSATLLILDEPTAALSLRQTRQVYSSIEAARDKNLAVIIISHNVDQMFPIADRFVVLRHGESVADLLKKDSSRGEIAGLIMGDISPADRFSDS